MTAAGLASAGPAGTVVGRPVDHRPVVLLTHGLSEAVGTFAVIAAVQTVVALLVAPSLEAGVLRSLLVALVGAAAVAAVVLSPVGRLSGAHLNPAVSLAFLIEGRLSGREFATYAAMQTIGAFLAPLAVGALVPAAYAAVGAGVVRPHPETTLAAVFLLEAAATAGLVLVLFFMTSDPRRGALVWLAKVGYLFVAMAALGEVTGASFNPARAAGPAILAGETADLWVYLAAPLLGAAAGALACRRLAVRPVHHRFGRPHVHPHYTLHWLRRIGVSAGRAADERTSR